ncbi:MAG: hypothetical protein PUF28_00455 [bacterium]|nr:hypothetical protein [bacterium]
MDTIPRTGLKLHHLFWTVEYSRWFSTVAGCTVDPQSDKIILSISFMLIPI